MNSTIEEVTATTLPIGQLAAHPDNIRDAGRALPALEKSIKEIGQIQPLVVVPVAAVTGHEFDQAVTHVVVDGNRRLTAAAGAGLTTLRCEVRPDLESAKATIRVMLATATMRDGLTVVETAKAIQGLFEIGDSSAAIVRATGIKQADVKAAQLAAKVTPEIAATADGLTLVELAGVAEFQHDEEATRKLMAGIQRGQFTHALAAARSEAEENAKIAAVVAELGDSVTLLEHRPSWDGTTLSVVSLTDANGTRLTAESHASCPGHAVYLDVNHRGEVRWNTYCTDPKANGHKREGNGKLSGPMTEEEKAERKAKVANNKKMVIAQGVRRDFLRTLIKAKKHHKAMTVWALERVVNRDRTFARWVNEGFTPKVIGELLGTEDPDKALAQAPASNHALLLWVEVASAYEAFMTKEAWQSKHPEQRPYLAHLVSLGYQPCDAELIIIGDGQ